MKKKLLYSFLFIIALLFVYLNYYQTEEHVDTGGEVILETKGALYEVENYVVKAKEQFHNLDQNTTEFIGPQVSFEGLTLGGDEADLDKDKNLVIKGNIFGDSPDGWSLKGDVINYNNIDETISSLAGTSLANAEKEVEIFSSNFLADKDLTYANFADNITMKLQDLEFESTAAFYDEEKGKVFLNEEVLLDGFLRSEEESQGDEKQSVAGKFQGAIYDLKTEVLTSKEPFKMTIEGITFHGENLVYNKKTNVLRIDKNVYLEQLDGKIDIDSIEYIGNKGLLILNGPIKGGNNAYYIEADQITFHRLKNIVIATGDIFLSTEDGTELTGDRITWNRTPDVIVATGNEKQLTYKKDGVFGEAKELVYHRTTEDIFLTKGYKYKDSDIESQGESLAYNRETEEGQVKNGYLKQEDFTIAGDLLIFDNLNQNYSLTGNLEVSNEDYTIKAKEAFYNGDNSFGVVPGAYTIEGKDNTKATGEYILFDGKSGDLFIPSELSGENDKYTFTGKDFTYNVNSGIATTDSDIIIGDKKNAGTFVAKGARFKKDEYLEAIGPIDFANQEHTIKTASIIYNFKSNIVDFPKPIIVKGKDVNGKANSGYFDVNKNSFTANNLNAVAFKNKVKANKAVYNMEKNYLEVSGNASIDGKDGKWSGEHGRYYTETETIEAFKPFVAHYDNMIIQASKGSFNNKNFEIEAWDVIADSKEGSHIEGDYLNGTLAKGYADLEGRVKAKFVNGDDITNYRGDLVRIYFVKRDDKLLATRAEVKYNGVFKYEDWTLTSDYIEVDILKEYVLGRRGTKIKSPEYTIQADVTDLDVKKEILTFTNNVVIEHKNQETGYQRVLADKGTVYNERNIAVLEGSVKATSESGTLEADKATYNFETKKIKGEGNVFVEYDTKGN